MPDDNRFSPAPSEPPMPEAHRGEFILYGSGEAEAKWTPCRFALQPTDHVWDLDIVREAHAWSAPASRQRFLAAGGALLRHDEMGRHFPNTMMVFPEVTPDNPTPSPATIVVPPDAYDMIGIRARVGDEAFDIQSREGRRQIAANGDANPSLARDVARWADCLGAVGEVAPEALAPRLGADLSIEIGMRRMFRQFSPLSAPAGVTPDGLARWRLMQEMRAEMRDEWDGDDCARVMDQLFSAPQLASVPVPSGAMLPEVAATVEAALADDGDGPVAIALSRLTAAPLETLSCVQVQRPKRGALATVNVKDVAVERGWTEIAERWNGLVGCKRDRYLDDGRRGMRPVVILMTRSFSDEDAPVGAAADMLLIADERGVHACAWPTWQRRDTLIHRPGGEEFPEAIPMVTAGEIPSMEELHELAVRVHARRQEARHESEARPAPLPQPAM